MSFMEPQIAYGNWWKVETTAGTEFVDADILSKDELGECCEGEIIDGEIEKIVGFGARLSAPGYLDCTPWDVLGTYQEAENYLRETYPEEFEDENE